MNSQEEITSFHVWKHDVKTDILSARSDNAESILNTKDLHHVMENNPGKIKSKLKNVERQEKNESKAWTQVKLRMKNKNSTDDLKVCKVVFNEKMTQFQERWQKVEKGKKEMKMNFIKYNNIVKDKQRKVADELSKFMMEKQKQLIIVKNLKSRSKELSVLKETFELLTKTIQKKQSYQDFLETVVNMAKNDFLNVQSFMNRILVLVEISNILKKRIKTAFDENVHQAKDVEIHNENTQKELMKNLVKLPTLQRQADEAAANAATKQRELDNIEENKLGKRVRITHIQLAIRSMMNAVIKSGRCSKRDLDEMKIEDQLGLIEEHIRVLSSITRTVKKMESEKYYLQPIVSQQKD